MRLSTFWQAALVLVGVWVVLSFAVPPFMPRSLMSAYMIIAFVGVLLYFSSEEQRWQEFKKPIAAALRDDDKRTLRWILLALIPILFGLAVYDAVKPTRETPLEMRQVHPSPPTTVKVFGKSYDLATLENPVRMKILKQLEGDADGAWKSYGQAVRAGSEVYYRNCFYCHGDLLNGKGHFARGLDPLPTDFSDVGTIAQLQESFLFWRITTGGPGLPKGATPWNSAMPVWHEMLNEDEVWNAIIFLYDYVGQVPRMWDQTISRAVTTMKEKVLSQRAKMSSMEIYELRCAVCHGDKGAGDGPAAEFLAPRPRDFTRGLWKYKTSPGDLPPRDADIYGTIKSGLTGTSMPGWSSLLSDQQIRDLVTLLKQFDTSATWAPKDAKSEEFEKDGRYLKPNLRNITDEEPTQGQISYSAESVAKGKEVFEENCRKCHGQAGRGNITSGKLLDDDWGQRIWPRDLTKPWTWRATEASSQTEQTAPSDSRRDETIRNIYQRVAIGIRGTPMPAHRAVDAGEKDAITPEGRWHVANYVYSLRAGTTWPGERNVLEGVELVGELPLSVKDPAWEKIPASTFRLVPNVVKNERLFTPLNNAITVRVAYNERDIAFLLEVNDRTESRPGGAVMSQLPDKKEKMFSDAVALQFPKEGAYTTAPVEKPLYRHGDPDHGTTIWYWTAGSVEPARPPAALLFDASGPDAKLARRESSADLAAQGEWQDGRWRVIMKRSRGEQAQSEGAPTAAKTPGQSDLVFRKGQFIPVSFANWDGNNGEVGAKHTLTPWFWLLLPPEINYAWVYGPPLLTSLFVFLAGLALVWSQRRKRGGSSRTSA
jgi:DMSO reductase family type II enzyme heme b subunit